MNTKKCDCSGRPLGTEKCQTCQDGQPATEPLMSGSERRLVRLDEVLRIISEHPEYPEPCPMLHEVAAAAARTMDKEWIIHMVRETCRQTKEAILADLKQSLQNVRCAPTAAIERRKK